MPEFEVGDRVRLEGIVVRANTKTLLAGIILDGARFPVNVSDEVMAHATLIEPAEEEKVQELDLSKPVRIKVRQDVEVREVFGPSSRGFCLVDRADGILDIRLAEELENIPEPKKTVMQEVNLHEYANGRRFFAYGYVYCAPLSKARITHTSGEGWSIEEVK